MVKAIVGAVVLGLVSVVAACTGGPGPLPDQGADQSDQGGGIQRETSSGGTGSDDDLTTTGGGKTSGGSGGGNTGTSGSSGSSGMTSVTDAAPAAPADLKASDYSQSCDLASDCSPVYQGQVCAPCPCPNSAIAMKDLAKHQADFSARKSSCGLNPPVACAACQTSTATCENKKCVFTPG